MFLDECGSNIALTPLYARAPKGERKRRKRSTRVVGKNTTLIAALSVEGMGAAMILEGSTNTTAFEVYVEQVLAPCIGYLGYPFYKIGLMMATTPHFSSFSTSRARFSAQLFPCLFWNG